MRMLSNRGWWAAAARRRARGRGRRRCTATGTSNAEPRWSRGSGCCRPAIASIKQQKRTGWRAWERCGAGRGRAGPGNRSPGYDRWSSTPATSRAGSATTSRCSAWTH
ncbi:hypothetical protein JYU34_003366 [Plutella xylostella]|uniref:Uncharacterized protein n=1 Tax=Plutella xylostella TaxID=51655 RepID=A0ABQ7QZY1_PLUXY|nr:hypothetical protein JYU34_003366 [Plutella xylostella]